MGGNRTKASTRRTAALTLRGLTITALAFLAVICLPAVVSAEGTQEIGAVGLQITKGVVTRTFTGSPAWRVGLVEGDHILAVNGESIAGLPDEAVTAKIRGPIGGVVVLSVSHFGQDAPHDISLTRASLASFTQPTTPADPGNVYADWLKRSQAQNDALRKQVEENNRAAAEVAAARAAASKARLPYVNKMKHTAKFNSYAAAGKFFAGTLRNQDEDFEGRMKFLGPQGTQSAVFVQVVKILQIPDKDHLLLGSPAILETATQHITGNPTYAAYGSISDQFTGSRSFEEDRCYMLIGELKGKHSYTTTRGFAKTIPAIFIYAIGTLSEGIEGKEGVQYGCH